MTKTKQKTSNENTTNENTKFYSASNDKMLQAIFYPEINEAVLQKLAEMVWYQGIIVKSNFIFS